VGEYFDVVRQAVVARLSRQRRAPSGLGRAEALAAKELALPETALTRWAADACRQRSEPWLSEHCVRTYIWGALFARSDGLAFDAEVLAAASLLHDLGLALPPAAPGGTCFAVRGARESRRLLASQPVDDARRERIAEAISLHLNVRVPPSQGTEAHLVHEGAAFDVVGARWHDVRPADRLAVLALHPRQDLKRRLVPVLREQASRSPRTRIAVLCRLGFLKLIQSSPFEE
jgi:hypothetical protein